LRTLCALIVSTADEPLSHALNAPLREWSGQVYGLLIRSQGLKILLAHYRSLAWIIHEGCESEVWGGDIVLKAMAAA
jgi:hypothetical protein